MAMRNVTDSSWRDEGRIPPPVLFAGAWLAQSILSSRRAGPLSKAAGAVIGGASLGLAATAAVEFLRRGTTLDPLVPDASELVTTGANAISRNPMYTGLVGLLVGRAVSRRSVRALVPAAVVAFLLDTRQVPAEERVLKDRFGAEFEAYCDRTPRWLDGRSVATAREALPEDPSTLVPERLREVLPDSVRSALGDPAADDAGATPTTRAAASDS